MTAAYWVQAQKMDPTINKIVAWMERKKLDTVKMRGEMSQELRQYLRQWEKLCLQEGVLYWQSNSARWDHNKLQSVVPPKYRLDAIWRAHDDVGHLRLKWMLDILQDWFYWPNLEDEGTQHIRICKHCLRLKGRPHKKELHLLIPMYPLELVHVDFLILENPHTSIDMNILVITNHFTWYVKAVVTPTQMAKQPKLLSGMSLWQIMAFPKNCWQTKVLALNFSGSKNYANWPVFDRYEQHQITLRLMAKPLLVELVH